MAAEVRLVTQTSDAEHPFAFRPAEVTVRAGQAVRWVDDDDVFHTVTSSDRLEPRQPNGRFDASLFRRGQSFTFTFKRPGVYHFYCRPHVEFMFGTVRVTE